MSEAKVEKIKVLDFGLISQGQRDRQSRIQEAAQKILVCLVSLLQPSVSFLNVCQGSSFATGVEVQDKRKRVMSISTGSKLVDTILGGAYISLFTWSIFTLAFLRWYHVTVHIRGYQAIPL